MSKEKVEQFKKEVISVVGGDAPYGALAGLICPNSNYLSSYLTRGFGARVYPLQKKYDVKIVGVFYDTEPYSCSYRVKDLETNEIELIQIV